MAMHRRSLQLALAIGSMILGGCVHSPLDSKDSDTGRAAALGSKDAQSPVTSSFPAHEDDLTQIRLHCFRETIRRFPTIAFVEASAEELQALKDTVPDRDIRSVDAMIITRPHSRIMDWQTYEYGVLISVTKVEINGPIAVANCGWHGGPFSGEFFRASLTKTDGKWQLTTFACIAVH